MQHVMIARWIEEICARRPIMITVTTLNPLKVDLNNSSTTCDLRYRKHLMDRKKLQQMPVHDNLIVDKKNWVQVQELFVSLEV